jgi:hypothetical protein
MDYSDRVVRILMNDNGFLEVCTMLTRIFLAALLMASVALVGCEKKQPVTPTQPQVDKAVKKAKTAAADAQKAVDQKAADKTAADAKATADKVAADAKAAADKAAADAKVAADKAAADAKAAADKAAADAKKAAEGAALPK